MKIQHYESYIDVSDKFSFKDFTNKRLMSYYEREDFPPGTVIYKSLFYHEKPGSVTFPYGMCGVTFIDCNLDNLFLPTENKYVNCTNRTFVNVNGQDMLINEDGKVVGPLHVYKDLTFFNELPWYKRLFYKVVSLWQ